MPRKPNINWRKSDAEKLSKEIERFNAKIYRTRNRHPELKDILPDTIKKADKQAMIEKFKESPRSEFKKELNKLDRFSRKGAEQEVVSKTGNRVTKWEKREVGLKVQQINQQRARERKRLENLDATSRGQEIGLKRGEMGSERMNELKPKKYNFDKIRGGKEWQMYKKAVEKMASEVDRNMKLEQYKANYIQALENVFGSHADTIKTIIEQLPSDIVVDIYYTEQEASIDFVYDPIEADVKLTLLEDIWQGVLDDYEANR